MRSEREILEGLRRRYPRIGDDCAVYRPRPGEELLFTTDFLIENVHFKREAHSARDIGHKTGARGLSDLAAMGATPRFCLLSLALPVWADDAFVRGIFRGFGEHGVELAGGDLARAPILVCDIVACGSAAKGTSLLRSGARPGDAIYVSGRLGGSALGLETMAGKALKRHLRPEPRLKLGEWLRKNQIATACMDLSDGLSIDLSRLCRESGVSAEIEPPPLFPGASMEQGLHGGEDYELLFTARRPVPQPPSGPPVSRIGTIRAGRPGRILLDGEPLKVRGFDHFAAPG